MHISCPLQVAVFSTRPLFAVTGGGEEDPPGGNPSAGSWTEWAWSAVPSPMSMLPITWDEPPDEDGDAGARLAAHERVLHFSVYVQQVDTVFKVRGELISSAPDMGMTQSRILSRLRVES